MNSDEIRRRWAERSGEYSPDYYAYYGPNETSESIRARLDAALDSDAAVLELGCSSGRHLAHLHEHGYRNLHGIEINDEAFDVMADTYPELADSGTFYADAIEDVVSEFDDGRFDAIYSVETLQHLHPDDEWVFDELVRITDDRLVTVENEGGDDNRADDGDVNDEDPNDEGPNDDGSSADGSQSKEDDSADGVDVNYVNGEFPLYYRDWNRVFTERGLVEVGAESTTRDTLREFRVA